MSQVIANSKDDVAQGVRGRTVEVMVNTKPVMLTEEHGRAEATGGEIKAAAIAQGVNIQPDFPLMQKQTSS